MEQLINNTRIYYETYGDSQKQPIIFLHGWGQTHQTFKYLYKQLESDYYIYTLDLAGFGDSEEPKGIWGVKEYADMLKKLVEHAKLKNPIIIAHSFGGRVAIQYASETDDLKKLILISSAGIKPKRKILYYYKIYKYKITKKILKALKKNNALNKYQKKSGSNDYKNATPKMKQVLVKTVNQDLTKILHKIKVPTLLMWGEKDTATPLRQAKILEKKIPNAGLVTFENCGHFSYLEEPMHFSIIINHFLKNN